MHRTIRLFKSLTTDSMIQAEGQAEPMMTTGMQTSSSTLHEAWALAGLMRGRYGQEALPCALKEAENETDSETVHIWNKIVECLSR